MATFHGWINIPHDLKLYASIFFHKIQKNLLTEAAMAATKKTNRTFDQSICQQLQTSILHWMLDILGKDS